MSHSRLTKERDVPIPLLVDERLPSLFAQKHGRREMATVSGVRERFESRFFHIIVISITHTHSHKKTELTRVSHALGRVRAS